MRSVKRYPISMRAMKTLTLEITGTLPPKGELGIVYTIVGLELQQSELMLRQRVDELNDHVAIMRDTEGEFTHLDNSRYLRFVTQGRNPGSQIPTVQTIRRVIGRVYNAHVEINYLGLDQAWRTIDGLGRIQRLEQPFHWL